MNPKPTFSTTESHFIIPGPAGDIEIATALPKEKQVLVTGVVCHPHPLYGGAMNNKVVTTLAKTMRSLGIATIRFNFRGVGQSAGSYAEGIGESEDLLAVLDWVKQVRPLDKVFLAGFSFGSYVAARVADQWPVSQLITVAPPVNHFDFDNLSKSYSPWLVVQGEQDEVVPAEEVFAWIKKQTFPIQLIKMPNASHFFHGHLIELQDLVSEVLAARINSLT